MFNVTEAQSGQYVCKVSNYIGEANQSAWLTVTRPVAKGNGETDGTLCWEFHVGPTPWSSGKPAPDSPSYLLYPSAQSHGKILGLGGWFGLVLCWCLLVPSVPYVCPLAGCVAVRGLLGTQPRCAMNDAADQKRGQVFPCRGPGLQAAYVCVCVCVHPSIPPVCPPLHLSRPETKQPPTGRAPFLHAARCPHAGMGQWLPAPGDGS